MNRIGYIVVSAVLALAATITLTISAFWYQPTYQVQSEFQLERSLRAAETGEEDAKTLLKTTMDKWPEFENLDTTNIEATIGEPTIRYQSHTQAILTVSVETITNNSTFPFEFNARCDAPETGDDTTHLAFPTGFVYVAAINTVPGVVAMDGSYGSYWGTPSQGADDEYLIGASGETLLQAQTAGRLLPVSCRVGYNSNTMLSLNTDFAPVRVDPGERVELTGQNTMEFLLTPAPTYSPVEFEQPVPLSESMYPYVFGGVYLVANDGKSAAVAPLR